MRGTTSRAGTWGVIAVMDSRSYEEDLVVNIPPGSRLVIAAADWPPDEEADEMGVRLRSVGLLGPSGLRPHLRGKLEVARASRAVPSRERLRSTGCSWRAT